MSLLLRPAEHKLNQGTVLLLRDDVHVVGRLEHRRAFRGTSRSPRTITPHSVQSTGTPSFPSSALMGGAGTTYSFTFTKTGTYRYNCAAHPGNMTGQVVVT